MNMVLAGPLFAPLLAALATLCVGGQDALSHRSTYHPMPYRFQELDYRPTDLGALILRRRWQPRLEAFSHEIKLGGDFGVRSAVAAGWVA